MRGYAAAAAAFTMWGLSTTVLMRVIVLPGPFITCFSCLVGALTLAAIIGPKRWWEARVAYAADRRRVWAMAATFAGCSLTFHLAVKMTLVANAVLTHTTYPVLTCLLFLPIFRRKFPGAVGLAALGLGIAGMTTLFWPQLAWRSSWTGEILGLASAVFFAAYCLLVDGWRTSMPKASALVPILFLSSLFMLPFGLAVHPALPSWPQALGIVAFGVTCFAVPNMLFYAAIRTVPVGHVTTLGYLEPVVAISTAAAFFHEPFTLHAVIGGVAILASGALIVLSGNKSPAS